MEDRTELLRECPRCGAPTTLDLCGNCRVLESMVFQWSNLEQLRRALDAAYALREAWMKKPVLPVPSPGTVEIRPIDIVAWIAAEGK